MENNKTVEFSVQIDGINLSEEAKKRIEKGIQSLVMQELADYKPDTAAGPDSGLSFFIPYGPGGGGLAGMKVVAKY